MAFTLEHVQQVRNGHPRQVGILPYDVWQELGWTCPYIYLGQTGLAHINKQHPDITDLDLLNLPQAIALGMLIHVKKDSRQLLVGYRNGQRAIYQSALKSAEKSTEIWVSSFYKVKPKRMRSMVRQGRLLRGHQ